MDEEEKTDVYPIKRYGGRWMTIYLAHGKSIPTNVGWSNTGGSTLRGGHYGPRGSKEHPSSTLGKNPKPLVVEVSTCRGHLYCTYSGYVVQGVNISKKGLSHHRLEHLRSVLFNTCAMYAGF